MQRISWLTIAILGMASGAITRADEAASVPIASAADAERVARDEEKVILKALSRKISFECVDMSLDKAVERIADAIDCDVLFDEKALADEGISKELTLTLKIGEVTAWQALHFILEPNLLTWVANDGVLEITTRTRADNLLLTRVYDVHKLCRSLEPLTKEMLQQQPRRRKPNPQGVLGGGGMGGGGGGGMFSVPAVAVSTSFIAQFGGGQAPQAANPVAMVPMSVEAVLAQMIINCTSLKWIDRDGDGGTIQLGQGCLIVSQSYHGQFEIGGMLEALEKLVEGGVPGKSIAAKRTGYPSDEETKIFETLAKPKNIDVEAETLDQVIGEIAKAANLPVWFDIKAMSDEGISVEAPVGLRRKMQKVPLGICLKKILDPLLLAWVVDEGVLVVTTQTRAADMLSVRFYDISRVSKIANEGPASGVVSVLSQSTHGSWQDFDGEGGNASLISSRHLAVLQTQQVHSEIALLIDDLTKDELKVPVEPALELHVYTAPNVETARDLQRVIPQLLESNWAIRGTIKQAGESLFINQPAAVHDRIEEIMEKLEQSNLRKNPPAKEPEEPKTPNPGNNEKP